MVVKRPRVEPTTFRSLVRHSDHYTHIPHSCRPTSWSVGLKVAVKLLQWLVQMLADFDNYRTILKEMNYAPQSRQISRFLTNIWLYVPNDIVLYGTVIGFYIRSIEPWHFRWPWVTFEGHFGDPLTVVSLCAQLTRDLLAIAKFPDVFLLYCCLRKQKYRTISPQRT